MEIGQLTHFVKVAQYQNITRAAADLGLSQPAVSRSIQKLEEDLGQPLFERQSRRMVLTEAGNLLLGRARQMLALIDDTRNEICDDGQSGKVRVGAIPTIAPFFLPELLSRFSEAYPKSNVVVQEDVTENLLFAVAQGEIDLAILALPVADKHLQIDRLFDEDLLLTIAADHPLANKTEVTLNGVKPFPFILLGEAHCLTDNIVSFCERKSFHPVSIEKTSQLATVQELVALGHGVSMVPMMARTRDTDPRRVYRPFSGVKPKRTIAVAWNPYRFESKLQKAFQHELGRYAKQFRRPNRK